MQLLSHSDNKFWIPDEPKTIFVNLKRLEIQFISIPIINFFGFCLTLFIFFYHELLQVDENKIQDFSKILNQLHDDNISNCYNIYFINLTDLPARPN